MTPQRKKWVRFWLVFAVWLVADLWSKHWADTSLATPRHPIPVTIAAADAGKSLGEVLAARFEWEGEELAKKLAKMTKLEPAVDVANAANPFARGAVGDSAQGLWVFWRDDRALPPRRIELDDRRALMRWVALAVPEASAESVRDVVQEAVAEWSFADWLPEMFRKLDQDDAQRLLSEARVHPIPYATSALSASTPVASGETYLVLHHQVDVMGSWWKLVYAENPGAAFGFLKGVSPGFRQTLFMLLTLIAFVVIGSIVSRLPPRGWLVATAFAGILAGAAGNFIDRVRFGYVIDFIDMDLGFMHWPTYNVADIAISVGVVALLLDLFFNKNSLLATKTKKGGKKKGGEEIAAPT